MAIRLSSAVRAIPVDTGLLLLDTSQGRLFAYNATAASLWQLFESGCTEPEAAAALVDACGLSSNDAARHVSDILQHWREHGLIHSDTRTSAPQAETWSSTVRGMRVSFAVEYPEDAPLLRRLFVEAADDGTPGQLSIAIRHVEGARRAVLVDDCEMLTTDDGGLVIGAVHQAVLEALHPETRWLALIHAGSVARNGRALALAAVSGSGKSTLSAYLARHGFDYLSDDLVALAAPDGRVVPWPMPVSVKEGSWAALAAAYPEIATLPAYATTKGQAAKLLPAPPASWTLSPAPLAAFVFPRFDAGGPAAELTPLRTLDALQHLLTDRIWLGYPITEEGVQAFVRFLERTPAYRLTYSSLPDAAERLAPLVS